MRNDIEFPILMLFWQIVRIGPDGIEDFQQPSLPVLPNQKLPAQRFKPLRYENLSEIGRNIPVKKKRPAP